MGAIRDAANSAFADGPSGNPKEPPKSEVRSTFGIVEDTIAAEATARETAVASEASARAAGDINVMSTLGNRIDALENSTREGVIVFATKADMDAELDYDENTEARVYTDPLPANNGIYRKVGASGGGSWSFLRAIDDYEFSITIEVSQVSTTVAGIDTDRKRLAVVNTSASARVALDIAGGTATLGGAASIMLPPQTGIYLDGSDCPVAAISVVADQDGVDVDFYFSSASADDPTVDAFVANFASAPSEPRKAAIAALRGGLISAGLLAKLDGLWMLAAANEDAASVNWVDGSKTLTTSGAPTFDTDEGYTGDATAAIVDTGVVIPGAKFKRDHASMACWLLDATTNQTQHAIGYGAGSIIANRTASTMGVRPNDTTNQIITKPSGTGGFYAWSRLDDVNFTAYWGGDFQFTDAVAPAASINSRSLIGLAVNGAGGPTAHSSHQLAFMAAGAGLTDTEMQTLRVLVERYLSNVGAI